MHGCSGLYRSKDILVQHTCQHTSAYSYDLIFEKTLSKAKAILQRQDTNEIAATFGTSPRPHVACRAKARPPDCVQSTLPSIYPGIRVSLGRSKARARLLV